MTSPATQEPCPMCEGRKEIGGLACAFCNGTGKSQRAELLTQPDGYAYRYPDGYIRHTNGRSVNGSQPVETLPWYYATSLEALLQHITAAQQRIADLEAQCARVQRDAEQLREYASRLEDHFVALAGVISNAEEDRARKEIAAERAVCFAAMAAKEAG